jgi:hypothetical protein
METQILANIDIPFLLKEKERLCKKYNYKTIFEVTTKLEKEIQEIAPESQIPQEKIIESLDVTKG